MLKNFSLIAESASKARIASNEKFCNFFFFTNLIIYYYYFLKKDVFIRTMLPGYEKYCLKDYLLNEN